MREREGNTMFITSKYAGYNRHDEQVSAGRFLILMQPKEPEGMRGVAAVQYTTSAPIRAIVRYVHMGQCGQFMMGSARVLGERIVVSGSYGGDGLPCTVPQKVYDAGIDVPPELIAA